MPFVVFADGVQYVCHPFLVASLEKSLVLSGEKFGSPRRKLPLVTDFYYFRDVKIVFHNEEKYFSVGKIYFHAEKIVFLFGFCNFAARTNGFICAESRI